jgi:hypothetical protein
VGWGEAKAGRRKERRVMVFVVVVDSMVTVNPEYTSSRDERSVVGRAMVDGRCLYNFVQRHCQTRVSQSIDR